MAGELEKYDDYDETRTDFGRWAGIYETWQRRKNAYAQQIKQQKLAGKLSESFMVQPAY
jgi:hypothetical protein